MSKTIVSPFITLFIMKTMKSLFPVLLGILALAMSSCTSTEYRPTDGDCKFVIKKIDGKRQWGMADARDNQEYIPCQYDSIFSAYGAPYYIDELFIAVKNGKKYAWTYRGKPLLEGKGFTTLVSNKQEALLHNNNVIGGGIFHEAKTDEGIIFFYLPTGIDWFEFGPAEAVLWGKETVLCKKNGKWAVLRKKERSEITPYIYDSVISVREVYFWVKKNGKWSAIDRNNKPIRKSTSLLNKYLKLPSLDYKQFQKEKQNALFRKISIEEASYISVDPWNADYISW